MSDNKNNLTTFQKLTNIFTKDGVRPPKKDIGRYTIGNTELLRTNSKQTYDTAKLQAQQGKHLARQWAKVDGELFQQAIHYETTRVGSYSDFEGMEFYPEISAALDIMMEEATTPNDKGKVLNIYSDSTRVKTILEELFFNRLDIHTNLPMWTRNTPIRENSIIPLLDGTETTIKELSKRVKNGEEIWSYAIQDGTKAIVPSKIVWCDLTRENSELYRVTLDDGTYIDTTPDHEYMLRDGSFKRADKLIEGQSLMPFYTKKEKIRKNDISGYEKVFDPNSNKYIFTHRVVVKEDGRDLSIEKNCDNIFVSHHIDFNKLNNSPSNLLRMTSTDHTNLHNKMSDIGRRVLNRPDVVEKRMEGIDRYLRSDARRGCLSKEMSGIYPKYFKEYNSSDLHAEHNIIRSEKMLSNWSDINFVNKTKEGMTIEISDACLNYISNIILSSNSYIGINKLADILKVDEGFIYLFKTNYTLSKDILTSINKTTLNKVIFRKTNKNYFDYILSIKPDLILDKLFIKARAISLGRKKEKSLVNHKVVSVIKLTETSDVYCLEAVGPNGENDRHNFPVCGNNVNGSFSRSSGVFLSNCKYGDNFVHLNIDGGNGIVGVRQLPNFEIERRDFDFFGNMGVVNPEDTSNKTKFVWKGKDLIFTSWQVGHFRLLGDDRKLPYGTSILEKARLIWKQLRLSEDAMLIYRVTRAPERRVYKIFVGNIDNEDVEAYVNEIANRFKRSPLIDPQTGQMDLRYNQMGYDQDIFIPTRKEDAATPIDTLPGAQNLDQIADIEYLQRKLFTALRVPKSFLGFEEATGEGKNLALQDIRFSRTINRIQQSMIQEMNKIAIIHLFLMGFEDDLDNFTLTLNNPSTQAEMLKVEHLSSKFDAYGKAVSDAGNGFGIMSMTRGKREILGWSDDEIKQDLLEQRMEKAAAAELENTSSVIKNTGVFDKVDKIYGDIEAARKGGSGGDGEGDENGGPSGAGGGFGGGGFGDSELDFGDDDEDGAEDADTEENSDLDFGGGDDSESSDSEDVEAPEKVTGESYKIGANISSLINENVKPRNKQYVTKKPNVNYMDRLIGNLNENTSNQLDNEKIVRMNNKINNGITKLMNEFDLEDTNE